jgi:WD40 repeat protein
VSSFGKAHVDDLDEPAMSAYGPLDYAAECAGDLGAALVRLGYDADLLTDPAALSAEELATRVEECLSGPGLAVVHVLSHGMLAKEGGVHVVGSDGKPSWRTCVENWRIRVSNNVDGSGPTTLFLLDLCHAGSVVSWRPPEPGDAERAWVIAAAGEDQAAYSGRLTRAVTAVIGEIDAGLFDQTVEYVDFGTFFELVRAKVAALGDGSYRQDPVGTPVMGAQPVLPFFPNPAYRPTPAAVAAAGVEAMIGQFVDPLDEQHFRDRAAARGPVGERVSGGCFTGRAAQLQLLSDWMDDYAEPGDAAAGSGLVVVTGSPGSGKSALLGVLVCAAHPALRDGTRELWRAAVHRPAENPHLGAVHARHRDLREVTDTLGRQLLGSGQAQAQPDSATSSGSRSPAQLVAEVAALPVRPVVVLDALDEAVAAVEVQTQLLLPLARVRRPDGSPACRLLVGTRPWGQFTPLLDLARASGEVVDLDAVPAPERRDDVRRYVESLLELMPEYSLAKRRAGRRAFAAAVADALVPDQDPPNEDRWGEFLVAALYTYTVTTGAAARFDDPAGAAALGAAAPRTLPEVFELDLARRPESAWRGALLKVLSHARGAGIARTVLPQTVAALADQLDSPSREELAAELNSLWFYLRSSADTDGTALLRFFHQTLDDHLRDAADAGAILDGMLATLPQADVRPRWQLAAPYLRRHAIQHAVDAGRADELLTDAGFLVYADSDAVVRELDHASEPAAKLAAAVYWASTSRHKSGQAPVVRDVLAVNAARHGADELRQALAQVPPPAAWRPRWASGSEASAALRGSVHLLRELPDGSISNDRFQALACTVLGSDPVAVTGHRDGMRVWDLATSTQLGELFGPSPDEAVPDPEGFDDNSPADITALAIVTLDTRLVIVAGSADGSLRLWDLATRTRLGEPFRQGVWSSIGPMDTTELDGGPALLADNEVWDLTTRTLLGKLPPGRHNYATMSVACGPNGRAVTGSSESDLSMVDLNTRIELGGDQVGEHERGEVMSLCWTWADDRAVLAIAGRNVPFYIVVHNDESSADEVRPLTDHIIRVIAATVTGKSVLVTGNSDGYMQMWHPLSRQPIGAPFAAHQWGVDLAVAVNTASQSLLVTTSGSEMRVWDLAAAMLVDRPRPGHSRDVKYALGMRLHGRPVAVTVDEGGELRVWDLATGDNVADPLPVGLRYVKLFPLGEFDSSEVVVVDRNGGRIWDLSTCTATTPLLSTFLKGVNSVARATLDGRPVVLGASDTTLFDMRTGVPLDVLDAAMGDVEALATAQLPSGPVVLIERSKADHVTIWDLKSRQATGPPLPIEGFVGAIATSTVDGVPIAVVAGRTSLQRWDLHTRTPLGGPLDLHVDHLTCGQLRGQPIALGGYLGFITVIDLREMRVTSKIRIPHVVKALTIGPDDTIIAAFGRDVVVLECD